MFKIDQVKKLFDCEQCNQLLFDPVTLSCGKSTCKKHLDKLLESSPKESDTFLCKLCDDEHCIPKKGFAINKIIQNALSMFECFSEAEKVKVKAILICVLYTIKNYLENFF